MLINKFKALRNHLRKEGLDALALFSRDPSFNYFAGSEQGHGLMILTKKKNYLFVSPLYKIKIPGFKTVYWKRKDEELKTILRKEKIRKMGACHDQLMLSQKKFLSKHAKIKDLSKFLYDIRQVKEKSEIAKLRKAASITDKIFSGIISGLKSGKFKTEKDISFFIKSQALYAGAEMSFEPIVASAGNGIVAHHLPGSKLKKGFMVMDFGARYEGYHADMTRTVYLGNPSKADREVYAKLLSIQEACISESFPGMKASSLFNYCVKIMGKDAKYFNHGLGHGIGLEIHEGPSLSPKSKDILQEGSVFTIEPGYYNKRTKVGIRIEDDVLLVSKKRKQILTRSTKQLIAIRI